MDNHQFRMYCSLSQGSHTEHLVLPTPEFSIYHELSMMAEEVCWWIEEKADAISYLIREHRERMRKRREERAIQEELTELMEAYAGGE